MVFGITLLDLKSTLNDSNNLLSNWKDTDESPCGWTGISCYPNSQTVRSINLPYMQLGGFISPVVARLTRLQRLALHQNSLHGLIPKEIAKCSELRALYLRGNYLQGSIPTDLGNLSSLTILDLSSNSLNGAIPSSLGRLTRLRNLQVNKPCHTSLGFPVILPHAESDEVAAVPNKRPSHYVKGALIGAVSTVCVAILLVLAIFFWVRLQSKKERDAKKYKEVYKQSRKETGTKLITFHGDLPYPSCEIIEKIESLTEEDIVGSGGYGTVYRMVMNDCGVFAVKKIDRSREGCDRVFERELEILGSVKHINLVNLRGY
ncbi:hypothetical protein AG4045_006698 [Apium graveolens]|uniref:Protein kinase domain-containing protein n=1 Tax=Apium graveolens TaxID=4045 RepID=A0A6L5B7K5_APIGR|nr:hypothetical protein AG4045_006698 [Apium graveolens]